ncbi:carotenoid biosynthesis protein [Euzebya rosea]|uniref:carotenoid biosynthesis protein n=1 Tax=Euzebya rosea TaxID=2052804 RepID=UPI00196A2E74|nr:carotenoid biosynthesis protein [Euzebya rosea]
MTVLDGLRRHPVPAALGAAAVLLQILYPLVQGPGRDRLTVVTVVVFSAASLSHAVVARGWRAAARLAAVFVGGGLLVEVVGVATGWPFGDYAYSDRLGWQVADVPVVIPFAWMMLGYPALVVARRITARPGPGILLGGVALASWDLFLDPQMVAEGYWTWFGDGPHLVDGIPVSNYAAWLAIALLMAALAWGATGTWDDRDDAVPLGLYLWTWAGSTLAHAAFFGLPVSALYGGAGMGAVVAVLWWSQRDHTEVVGEVERVGS